MSRGGQGSTIRGSTNWARTVQCHRSHSLKKGAFIRNVNTTRKVQMDEDLRTESAWIIRAWFPKLTISWSFSGPRHKGQQPCRRMFGYIRMPRSHILYYSPRSSLNVSTQAPYCHIRHFKFLSNSLHLLPWVLEEEIDRLTFLQVTFLCLSSFKK